MELTCRGCRTRVLSGIVFHNMGCARIYLANLDGERAELAARAGVRIGPGVPEHDLGVDAMSCPLCGPNVIVVEGRDEP